MSPSGWRGIHGGRRDADCGHVRSQAQRHWQPLPNWQQGAWGPCAVPCGPCAGLAGRGVGYAHCRQWPCPLCRHVLTPSSTLCPLLIVASSAASATALSWTTWSSRARSNCRCVGPVAHPRLSASASVARCRPLSLFLHTTSSAPVLFVPRQHCIISNSAHIKEKCQLTSCQIKKNNTIEAESTLAGAACLARRRGRCLAWCTQPQPDPIQPNPIPPAPPAVAKDKVLNQDTFM